MRNPVCHFEIGCSDYARAREFYSKLFDWRFDKVPSGDEMIRTGHDVGGHLSTRNGPEPYSVFYVMVDDVAAAIAQAEALGGRVVRGPVKEQHAGTWAWLADPDGNTVGVYTDKQ